MSKIKKTETICSHGKRKRSSKRKPYGLIFDKSFWCYVCDQDLVQEVNKKSIRQKSKLEIKKMIHKNQDHKNQDHKNQDHKN